VETFSGANYAINPDDTTASAAHLLGSELSSLVTESEYVLIADAPWDKTDVPRWQYLRDPVTQANLLTSLPSATLQNPAAFGAALFAASNRPVRSPDEGFSVLVMGHNLRVLGVLTVSTRTATAPANDLFQLYEVRLFGDSDSGYTELYSYAFASPKVSAQVLPSLGSLPANKLWTVTLPDPGASTDRPDGTPTINPESSLVYVLSSGL
jgi:hypothetical protein